MSYVASLGKASEGRQLKEKRQRMNGSVVMSLKGNCETFVRSLRKDLRPLCNMMGHTYANNPA